MYIYNDQYVYDIKLININILSGFCLVIIFVSLRYFAFIFYIELHNYFIEAGKIILYYWIDVQFNIADAK